MTWLARTWPVRWWRTLRWLLRGVRVHPQALLVGAGRTELAHGVSISRGCVLQADAGGRIGLAPGVWLARDVEIETTTQVLLGAGTTVQRRCGINGSTRIGANCILAPDVFISSGSHPFREMPHLAIRVQEQRLAASTGLPDRPVWIQDDCWIGVHAVVMPGVTIGKGAVVGANSVVTRDVAPYTVVAGMPAKPIAQRLAWEPPSRVDPLVETDQPYVLSGRLDAAGVAPDTDVPLLVALRAAADGEAIRIVVRCAAACRLRVNGVEASVDPSTTQIWALPGPYAAGASLQIESVDAAPHVSCTLFELARRDPA